MTGIRLFLLFFLFNVTMLAKGESMSQRFYVASLNVECSSKYVILHIHYKNVSEVEIFIDQLNPNLQVKDKDGAEMQFIGPMIKRLPLAISDYIKLQIGQTYDKDVRLDRLYEFEPGKVYSISMDGGYLNPINNEYYKGDLITISFAIPTD